MTNEPSDSLASLVQKERIRHRDVLWLDKDSPTYLLEYRGTRVIRERRGHESRTIRVPHWQVYVPSLGDDKGWDAGIQRLPNWQHIRAKLTRLQKRGRLSHGLVLIVKYKGKSKPSFDGHHSKLVTMLMVTRSLAAKYGVPYDFPLPRCEVCEKELTSNRALTCSGRCREQKRKVKRRADQLFARSRCVAERDFKRAFRRFRLDDERIMEVLGLVSDGGNVCLGAAGF